jgi:hypothetical protein
MTSHLWKDIFTESKWGKLTENISTEIHGQFQFGQKPTETECIRFFDIHTPKQNSPSNQMKDWLPSNDSPVTGGLFYSLVVLESSLDLLPSFSDHLAYMKAVDSKCQNFHHSFQKGQNFWWGSKVKKYVLSTTGTVSQRTHHFVWFSEDGKKYTVILKTVFFNCLHISSLAYSSQNFHHQCSWTCTSTRRMLKLHVLRTLVDLIDWL